MHSQLLVTDVKVFVPAKDFQLSLSYYRELGWEVIGMHDKLAELEMEGFRFFLQDYYNRGWANNFLFYINVTDSQAWYEHIAKILEKGNFGKARVNEPVLQSHGDIVTHAWDPSGVLIHFAQAQN